MAAPLAARHMDRVWWLLACREDPTTDAPDGGGTSSTGDSGTAEATWHDVPLDNVVNGRRFLGLLPSPSAVTLDCVADGDPSEHHRVELPPTTEVEVVMLGLLADTTYTCDATTGHGTTGTTFHTGPLPDGLPVGVRTAGTPWGGYVLANYSPTRNGAGQHVIVLDVDGRVRWYHPAPGGSPDVDASWVAPHVLFGGGYGIPPTRVSLEGVEVARAVDGKWNHHVQALADGTTLSERTVRNTDPTGAIGWNGFEIVVLDAALDEVAWAWDSQRAVDAGFLDVPTDGTVDPYHANAFVERPDGDLLVNLYRTHELFLLDRETGEPGWSLGWRKDFALLEADGAPAADDRWFFESHAPELEGDRILLYDNGKSRPSGASTRVVELELDESARTARLLWEWTEPRWFEPIWGDVDRLPNGHVSVTAAHCEGCAGVDPARTTELVELDPGTGAVVWRLTFRQPGDVVYRSERLGGCDLFANTRYCPEP